MLFSGKITFFPLNATGHISISYISVVLTLFISMSLRFFFWIFKFLQKFKIIFLSLFIFVLEVTAVHNIFFDFIKSLSFKIFTYACNCPHCYDTNAKKNKKIHFCSRKPSICALLLNIYSEIKIKTIYKSRSFNLKEFCLRKIFKKKKFKLWS
jgi:hypothetical protein